MPPVPGVTTTVTVGLLKALCVAQLQVTTPGELLLHVPLPVVLAETKVDEAGRLTVRTVLVAFEVEAL